ncbi:MAG: DUF1707 domain-containing protein [Propionibacterium sp.]|nr:DUF1707 domain-containing protein [Propionibacterium sp.]
MDPNIRIGDAERDEAISRLRAHHAAGRIDMVEFDDRMASALEARTAGDLLAIFADLPDQPFDPPPGALPQDPYAHHPVPAPQPYLPQNRPMQSVETKVDQPFYASGGLIWLIFFVMIVSGGRLWPLLVIAAIWVWGVVPITRAARNQPQVEPQRYYFPAGDIRAEVSALLRANRKIEAVKRWREVYGVGLKEAKDAVEAIEREDRGIGY